MLTRQGNMSPHIDADFQKQLLGELVIESQRTTTAVTRIMTRFKLPSRGGPEPQMSDDIGISDQESSRTVTEDSYAFVYDPNEEVKKPQTRVKRANQSDSGRSTLTRAAKAEAGTNIAGHFSEDPRAQTSDSQGPAQRYMGAGPRANPNFRKVGTPGLAHA